MEASGRFAMSLPLRVVLKADQTAGDGQQGSPGKQRQSGKEVSYGEERTVAERDRVVIVVQRMFLRGAMSKFL
jgi:hypothetical protein